MKTKTLFVILAVVMFVAGLISGHVVSSHYSSNTVYTVVTSDSIDIIMKDLHGLKHCIYGRGENGDPGVFFFYQGMPIIRNPKKLPWCPVFGPTANRWYNQRQKRLSQ